MINVTFKATLVLNSVCKYLMCLYNIVYSSLYVQSNNVQFIVLIFLQASQFHYILNDNNACL